MSGTGRGFSTSDRDSARRGRATPGRPPGAIFADIAGTFSDIAASSSRVGPEAGRTSARFRLAVVLVLIGALGAGWLAVTGVRLLVDIDGPGCGGEFPFCTTPSQQSARQVFAVICGIGLVGYLLAAVPALRSRRRFGLARVAVVLVILLALAALVADPLHHLDGTGSGHEWFVGSWPLGSR